MPPRPLVSAAMGVAQGNVGAHPRQLRVWPGVVTVILAWGTRYGLPIVFPEAGVIAVGARMLGAVVVLLWWLFFSRAAWIERLAAVVLMAASLFATTKIIDKSIATGMMGMMFIIYSIPVMTLALVIWAVVTRRRSTGIRWATMVATILVASGGWALMRTDGIRGIGAQLAFRWAKTPEEKLLARTGNELPTQSAPQPAAEAPKSPDVLTPSATADTPAAVLPVAAKLPLVSPDPTVLHAAVHTTAEWPGFRGPRRDGVIRGVKIKTDWNTSPPVQIWRREIGPGWSSFAVGGGLIYTQEQRGDSEVVACYRAATGEPVWMHRDPTRFWESNGGAGPRATPTLSDGHVYTFGATGIVNALDAATGSVLWTRNAASENDIKVPEWGFSSSPLVLDDQVIVAVSGRLVSYDAATGKPRWQGPPAGGSYSSPHLLTLGGVPQVLLSTNQGLTSVAPADGAVLWKHAWPGFTIIQPALTADGGILISTTGAAGGMGVRRIATAHGTNGWTAEERWTSQGLKPYFNDLVVHHGYAFGFDGAILSCIDLQDGHRAWKGGRYGQGQMILLSDQDLLLVLSEEGELALVNAAPTQFTEVARFQAVEGKTWNHPVLFRDTLLVRNGQEMAAFRLSLVSAEPGAPE